MVIEFIKRNKIFIIYTAIFALAVYLRLFQFGEVPNGLYQDETAIGFNAYSILETGKDEYGKDFPLYFRSFGDYKFLQARPRVLGGLHPKHFCISWQKT